MRYCEKAENKRFGRIEFAVGCNVTKAFKTAVVTDIKQMDGESLIHWLHKRCGRSEQIHSVMKEDLAGGRLPSSDFGANAAWLREKNYKNGKNGKPDPFNFTLQLEYLQYILYF